MEECDSPQGFQAFSDSDDGYCGLSSALLERLADDYPKKSILTTSVSMYPENDPVKLYNRSLGIHHLSQVSSLLVPLTIPSLESMKDAVWSKYLSKKTSKYHWSGYLSSVIQTMLFPTYFAVNGVYMSQMELCSIFKKNNDAPLAALNAILPFPIKKLDSGDIQNTLQVLKQGDFHHESVNLTTMKPFDKAHETIAQISVLRGATSLIKDVCLEGINRHRYSTTTDIQSLLDSYLKSFNCPLSKR